MLDKDLAELYQVETKAFNQAVKKNLDPFPDDFMFQFKQDEYDNLRSQFVISSWEGCAVPPIRPYRAACSDVIKYFKKPGRHPDKYSNNQVIYTDARNNSIQ